MKRYCKYRRQRDDGPTVQILVSLLLTANTCSLRIGHHQTNYGLHGMYIDVRIRWRSWYDQSIRHSLFRISLISLTWLGDRFTICYFSYFLIVHSAFAVDSFHRQFLIISVTCWAAARWWHTRIILNGRTDIQRTTQIWSHNNNLFTSCFDVSLSLSLSLWLWTLKMCKCVLVHTYIYLGCACECVAVALSSSSYYVLYDCTDYRIQFVFMIHRRCAV